MWLWYDCDMIVLILTWVCVTMTLTQSDLASMSWRHLLARASQPSVWLSISPRSVIQSSRFVPPSRPPTLFPDKDITVTQQYTTINTYCMCCKSPLFSWIWRPASSSSPLRPACRPWPGTPRWRSRSSWSHLCGSCSLRGPGRYHHSPRRQCEPREKQDTVSRDQSDQFQNIFNQIWLSKICVIKLQITIPIRANNDPLCEVLQQNLIRLFIAEFVKILAF